MSDPGRRNFMDMIIAAIIAALIVGPKEVRMMILKWIGVIILVFLLMMLAAAAPVVFIILAIVGLIVNLSDAEK